MLFLKNKYTKIYFKIINKAKLRLLNCYNYTEKHHIIPTSFKILKNCNYKNNTVRLTAKEHYICHMILAKISIGTNKYKMKYAFDLMGISSNNERKHTGATYQINRESLKGINNSIKLYGSDNGSHDTCWISNIVNNKSIKIPKVFLKEYLEIGYKKGRIINFEKEKKRLQKKEKSLEKKLEKYYHLKKKFKYYQKNSWIKTKKKFKLYYTHQNLLRKFKIYFK